MLSTKPLGTVAACVPGRELRQKGEQHASHASLPLILAHG
jgi:hypothetical protein